MHRYIIIFCNTFQRLKLPLQGIQYSPHMQTSQLKVENILANNDLMLTTIKQKHNIILTNETMWVHFLNFFYHYFLFKSLLLSTFSKGVWTFPDVADKPTLGNIKTHYSFRCQLWSFKIYSFSYRHSYYYNIIYISVFNKSVLKNHKRMHSRF